MAGAKEQLRSKGDLGQFVDHPSVDLNQMVMCRFLHLSGR
jgi:hypothetical protein